MSKPCTQPSSPSSLQTASLSLPLETPHLGSSPATFGFKVEKCELEYRPTKCTPKSADGAGGLEGWIKLMGAEMLGIVEEGKRDDVVRQVCEVLETVVTREEDGSQWLNYVRLRAVARKV
jgi:hypothetical protein